MNIKKVQDTIDNIMYVIFKGAIAIWLIVMLTNFIWSRISTYTW